APSEARVASLLRDVLAVIETHFSFKDKSDAKASFLRLTAMFRDLNLLKEDDALYRELKESIDKLVSERRQ
ncbi:MAG TPA: hypothetical protein VEK06_01390, partial [Myxococcota bacterium]|nr:hypothetical protein [Myxococcota bacterium]